jgi:hypothetical protein
MASKETIERSFWKLGLQKENPSGQADHEFPVTEDRPQGPKSLANDPQGYLLDESAAAGYDLGLDVPRLAFP